MEGSTSGNVERLEEYVARGRAGLAALPESEQRQRRGEAIAAFTDYIGLLRETATSGRERYAFKLEFPDGRWDIAEQALLSEPHVGDLVWFEGVPWQVLGHRSVPRKYAHTPHEFLACAPAAA
jgi:hypothetical protein